jgi:hypothetical protein
MPRGDKMDDVEDYMKVIERSLRFAKRKRVPEIKAEFGYDEVGEFVNGRTEASKDGDTFMINYLEERIFG